MNYSRLILLLIGISLPVFSLTAADNDKTIKVFTWAGYVLPEDIKEVNELVKQQGYDYQFEVITPFAEGPDQMYNVMRSASPDISFTTSFYIKMQEERIAKLLQPINVNSPRLGNYRNLNKSFINLPMGTNAEGKTLYIPYLAGAYNFYADVSRIPASDVPTSIKDLWNLKWKGKISFNLPGTFYNVAFATMKMGLPAFALNTAITENRRDEVTKLTAPNGELQKSLNELFANAGNFWSDTTIFDDNLAIVSSWGMDSATANAGGRKWKMIHFQEGGISAMDTITFLKSLTGKKLEAAEIFANYYIGKKMQTRVAGIAISVSNLVDSNPMLENFNKDLFLPPYTKAAENIVQQMSDRAVKQSAFSNLVK